MGGGGRDSKEHCDEGLPAAQGLPCRLSESRGCEGFVLGTRLSRGRPARSVARPQILSEGKRPGREVEVGREEGGS